MHARVAADDNNDGYDIVLCDIQSYGRRQIEWLKKKPDVLGPISGLLRERNTRRESAYGNKKKKIEIKENANPTFMKSRRVVKYKISKQMRSRAVW